MLSALAARKARLQATPDSRTPSHTPPVADSPSKRKSSTHAPITVAKKRRVQPSRSATIPRTLGRQDVDEADSSSSESSSGQPQAQPVTRRGPPRRGWSPGAALHSSSDEGAFDNSFASNEPVSSAVGLGKSTLLPIADISTFQPLLGQNVFPLAADEELPFLPHPPSSPSKLLLLRCSERLTFVGVYSLTLIYGSISLNGTTLHPSTQAHRVFAPRSSPLPVIECVVSRGDAIQNLPSSGPISNAIQRADAAVVIHELGTGVEGLGHACKTFEDVFHPPRSHLSPLCDIGLKGVQMIPSAPSDVQVFILPASWRSALQQASVAADISTSRQVYLTQGPKRVGKSTFSRTLLNTLLTRYRRVAFLECDIGQSEFTPGGMVALNVVSSPVFGPPFTHFSLPHRVHYIGSPSPQHLPSHYLEAIENLVHTYNADIQYDVADDIEGDDRIADLVPLVVNTMGWTKGLGTDLSRRISELLEPSMIFAFETPTFDDNWPSYPNLGNSLYEDVTTAKSHVLEPILSSPATQRYSPADHRTLSLLSYFYAVFPSEPHAPVRSWNTTVPLCAQLPYELILSSAVDAVVLCGPGLEDVVSHEIGRVLNGALVALVACEAEALPITPGLVNRPPYLQGASLPPPTASSCIGLGLIRSADLDSSGHLTPSSRLQLLTSVPPEVLCKSPPRVLVKGDMEIPVWGMLDFRGEDGVAGVERGKVPFLRWGRIEGMGSERRRVRRNLMRRGQQ